ncbi:MAG: AGE family epimerase/isomerase [Colwellia sp.]
MTQVQFTCLDAKDELKNIADWWLTHTIDKEHGGFVGEVDFYGKVIYQANKGIVQNSRILWFFSEAANAQQDIDLKEKYRQAANLSYDYLIQHFNDEEYGGAVWELNAEGKVVNDKKQTYAQSFCIYAFSAYYQLTKNSEALAFALKYFQLLEQHAKDPIHGGYIEAYTRQWQVIDDFRLSDKDLNAPKSMNTHLHVLEAYSALYKVAPSAETEQALRYIIQIFEQQIINKENYHLRLFFDVQWQDLSQYYSYGHDIEASWLLWEALEILNDEPLKAALKPCVIAMAEVCLEEGIAKQGQVCDEISISTQHREEKSCWWIQAEALVGFLNAYQLTEDKRYLHACDKTWLFIKKYHIDDIHGEWHWLSSLYKEEQPLEYKACFWKAPYHNGRAMMEVSRLFALIERNNNV